HRVTVFEATERLGGMMRLGIPEYRLPRDVLDREIEAILSLGVEVRTSAGLGAQRTLDSLMAEGFDAVFLASGAGRGRDLEVDGGDLDGVVRAIDFLINVNGGFRMDIGTRVVVVGGGNVAMDVARTARLGRPPDVRAPSGPARALPGVGALRSAVSGGAKEVHLVARQPMGEWPAQRSVHGREEVEEAKREGLVFHPLRGVRRIVGEKGRAVAVELAEVVSLRDERGRYAPSYGAHAAETIPCDTVFLAIGQEPDLDYLAGTKALRRTRDGLIETDPETLATSLPGVYAGGDAAFGPRTLIEAVAEGKRAARNVHARLSGGRSLEFHATFTEVHPRSVAPAPDYDRIPRVEPSCVSVDRRTGIQEVEGSYDEAEARRQASRCLSCHVQTIYDGSLCIACGRCTDICPYHCLTLAPADLVGAADLPSLAAAGNDTVMVKDETSCIRCGLCAERCPTGAMTMETFDWKVGAVAP
ncbi:MAG TPA: FAD-dependent oxidoreductase, partial [Planctomycetota bacterium]|nr:FAD-dependent oxidoreductase [Planctomycetota bacterium]